MAETNDASPASKKATKGDSWVQRHKVALIGGGIAVALVLVFIIFRNKNSSVAGYPTGNTASLASINPYLNTSGDLSNLVGPQGPAGATGPPGPKGPRGPRGPKGPRPPRHPHKPKATGVIPIDHLANAPR